MVVRTGRVRQSGATYTGPAVTSAMRDPRAQRCYETGALRAIAANFGAVVCWRSMKEREVAIQRGDA
eukprot:IDg1117t1